VSTCFNVRSDCCDKLVDRESDGYVKGSLGKAYVMIDELHVLVRISIRSTDIIEP